MQLHSNHRGRPPFDIRYRIHRCFTDAHKLGRMAVLIQAPVHNVTQITFEIVVSHRTTQPRKHKNAAYERPTNSRREKPFVGGLARMPQELCHITHVV